jgi:protein involved in polysaccharide export with SLBB domain
MPHDAQRIDVMVSGAVHTVGRQSLGQPATIRSALDAAGGLAAPAPQMKPADKVTVRRPLGDRKVDVFRFSLSEVPAKWEEFPLADGDLVVFQWDIEVTET